ncbi:MAG: homoserine O-acetyltransferase [Raineya sp.]|nr:homoserine O-acetyltransferase [Raineya sp.]
MRNFIAMTEPAIFHYKNPFPLESGDILPEIELAYCTYGTLNAQKNNVIWVIHALTANADVADWWAGLFGAGKMLDPEKYFIVCANNLGSCYGSTGALSVNPQTGEPYFHSFPLLTTRDMARALELLRRHLDLPCIHYLMGGSLGGQIALEWAIEQNEIFDNLLILATNAFHSPWGIAFNEAQRMAIQADASWQYAHPQAGMMGLKAARAIALLSYRNIEIYNQRQQETDIEKLDGYKASSYQQYQGEKLIRRFNAFSYWTLSKAMDSHHVGRGRGSAENALQQIRARVKVVGITSDLLFPLAEQKFLAEHIPNATLYEIQSLYGHDGFLLEFEQIQRVFEV